MTWKYSLPFATKIVNTNRWIRCDTRIAIPKTLGDFDGAFITIKQVSFTMVLVIKESLAYFLVSDKGAC